MQGKLRVSSIPSGRRSLYSYRTIGVGFHSVLLFFLQRVRVRLCFLSQWACFVFSMFSSCDVLSFISSPWDCYFLNICVSKLVQKLPIRLRRISSGQPGHLLHIRMGYVCWTLVAKRPIHSALRVGVHLPPILSVKRAHIIFFCFLYLPPCSLCSVTSKGPLRWGSVFMFRQKGRRL